LDGLAIVPIMTTAAVLLVTSYVTGHKVFAEYLQFQYIAGSGELVVILASVIGVGLGFLWYNAHPATVFMGDVGSLSLGGLLGAVSLMTHKEIVLLIAGMLFVMEAVSVMLQVGSYKTRGKRVFKMAPLHHHFELAGWPESKVIVRFWILSILFALAALTTLKIR
jgi:phospho-N-acetylmuramoyl-pentapeptide-transferase